MNFYSTERKSPQADFREATIRGQAPDKGLYFPQKIPILDPLIIKNIDSYTNEEIAYQVIQPYVGNGIPEQTLREIVAQTIDFPIPLRPISDKIATLELFHGPTLAFKDIGARFMSRCLAYFVKDRNKKVCVLVATSGDTGGAVANGFYGVKGVEVVILYPSGKVSPVQEKQLTTLGKNIHALEVSGSFDDCQRMVKQAFADRDLIKELFLTSANSINVARWLPQQFYYFFAWKQWKDRDHPPIISVPSGNFGNICAGILAQSSGLPVRHFIAACNANNTVTEYMQTHEYKVRKAIPTLSNAMDVGDPSNFIRILEIVHQAFPELKSRMSSQSISDKETIETIKRIYKQFNYLLDPHGAVGYLALERYLEQHPAESGIVLETAHPVKFPDAFQGIVPSGIPIPESLKEIMGKEKTSQLIPPDYEALKAFLRKE